MFEKRIGRKPLQIHPVGLGARRDLKVNAILAGLATGFAALTAGTVVRLARNQEEVHIRLYSPRLSRMSSDFPRFKKAINAVLDGMWHLW